jgi:RNA ligase (TIGR02306 family)
MARKLATITKIKESLPIDGADAIEAVTMTTNGWTCVVKKGDFAPGDFGVYFEIDSFLPKEERYAFLEGRSNKTFNGVEGYRLKTIRLRGQISQGLILPLSDFPEITKPKEGADVTALLNVQLYEPPIAEGSLNPGGRFPSFVWKTDQERIQSMSEKQLAKLDNKYYEVTEKLDGKSCTFFYKDGHFGICSRNLELTRCERRNIFSQIYRWIKKKFCGETRSTEGMASYGKMADKYQIEKRLTEYCLEHKCNIAIQGEIVGYGIQNNSLKLPAVDFYVFDVFDIDQQYRLDSLARQDIVAALGLKHVPIIEVKYQVDFNKVPVTELVKFADGESMLSPGKKREGLVYKQHSEIGSGKQVASFKTISNTYLLKTGE